MRRITWFAAGPLETSGIFITLFFSTLFYFGIYAIEAVNAAFKVVDDRLQISNRASKFDRRLVFLSGSSFVSRNAKTENFLLIVNFEDIISKVEGKLIFITFLSRMVAANIVVMVINLMVAVYIKLPSWTRCNVYICYDNKI